MKQETFPVFRLEPGELQLLQAGTMLTLTFEDGRIFGLMLSAEELHSFRNGLRCRKCGKTFTDIHGLNGHMNVHGKGGAPMTPARHRLIMKNLKKARRAWLSLTPAQRRDRKLKKQERQTP